MASACVVGCGVIGLTVATLLQKYGFKVKILTEHTPLTCGLASNSQVYTSDKAGAHWFSFAESGETQRQAMDELSFAALYGLAVTEPNSGISIVRGHAVFEKFSVQSPGRVTIPWWSTLVPRFRLWTVDDLATLRARTGVSYVGGFSYETVMVHVPHYLLFLYSKFLNRGGKVCIKKLSHIQEAFDDHDVVVNCCGLGSACMGGVADDGVFPDRGQIVLIRLANPDAINEIWRAPDAENTTYILPRGDGTVVLGGTHHVGNFSLVPDPLIAADILARSCRLCPMLQDPGCFEVVAHSVGLRPGRRGCQRVEAVDVVPANGGDISGGGSGVPGGRPHRSTLLVHAYGHGGDGFQASWGTAVLVMELISRARPQLVRRSGSSTPLAAAGAGASDAGGSGSCTPTFNTMHSQFKTGVLERAFGGQLQSQSKL